MTGYCLQDKDKECEEARQKVLKQNHGKLPEKYKHTTLDSCLYCSGYMEE